MRVHILQHVHFEGIGSIAGWLRERNAVVSYTHFDQSANLPDPYHMDLIIVMGGPMSVHDEDLYPWLVAEKCFLREVMTQNIPVLGICLGAQLLAHVLGAAVYRHRHKEIGWFPVQAIERHDHDQAYWLPEQFMALHWHGETFDLPVGAIHLASSAACQMQAFQYQQRVIGLQFHLEATPQTTAAMLLNCVDDLTPTDPWIQTPSAISLGVSQYSHATISLLYSLLDQLATS